MKIVLTGSLGHISKPLAEELVRKGHDVTVISSKEDRRKEIEAMGATAAIGTVEDAGFLESAFKGGDAVYTMIPPGSYNDENIDVRAQVVQTTNNYKHAIERAGVRRVVQLSSIGAHMERGNGILGVHYEMERLLNELPSEVSVTFMRPVGFYYSSWNEINATPALHGTRSIQAPLFMERNQHNPRSSWNEINATPALHGTRSIQAPLFRAGL